jgi:2-(3-amino-3-carboxypropyl)histidine synthase
MIILLQFPEGLKKEAAKYAEKYEKEGHEVFLSASPCYGGCDLALDEAKAINADKLIHFGHAKFVKQKLPVEVEYIEYNMEGDLGKFKKAVQKLKEKRFSLVTTVQYVHQLQQLKSILEECGKEVHIGKGIKTEYAGQVLGCDHFAIGKPENFDAILYFGEGLFHPLVMDAKKSVYSIHPKEGTLKDLTNDIEKRRKKRNGMLARALQSKSFGIIVSTKTGQFAIETARWAKKELEKRKNHAYIALSNEIFPLSLNNFLLFDCYVVVACPRLSDDSEAFGKPVLDIELLKKLLDMSGTEA